MGEIRTHKDLKITLAGKKTFGQINHEREAGRHIEEGGPRKMADDPGIDTKSELTCLGHGYTGQTNEDWRHDPCT